MGAGDWLMATGQVKRMYAANGVPVVVVGINGLPVWSDVFTNNPKILRYPRGLFQTLRNGPNARPYIARRTDAKWYWRAYRPEPGELYFSPHERSFANYYRGRIMVEPNVKAIEHNNKAWPLTRWQELVDRKAAGAFIQCGPEGTRWLHNVERVVTPTFRQACAVLAVSRAFVGCEGGLMHAAAAVGVRGVILYSEFIGVESTGYDMHRNIRHAGPACGLRSRCEGCVRAMDAITVDEVATNLAEVF